MKYLLLLLLTSFCLPAIGQQKQDYPLDSSYIGNKAWRVKIPAGSFGWVLENSADKGQTWNTVEPNINGLDSSNISRLVGMYPTCIHFIDDSTGFAFGEYPQYISTYFVLRTGDGGRSWQLVSDWSQLRRKNKDLDKLSVYFRNKMMHFRSNSEGIVFLGYIENNIVFLETRDKGRTWKNFKVPITADGYYLYGMKFTNALDGELELKNPTDKTPRKLLTTDGGLTWKLQ